MVSFTQRSVPLSPPRHAPIPTKKCRDLDFSYSSPPQWLGEYCDVNIFLQGHKFIFPFQVLMSVSKRGWVGRGGQYSKGKLIYLTWSTPHNMRCCTQLREESVKVLHSTEDRQVPGIIIGRVQNWVYTSLFIPRNWLWRPKVHQSASWLQGQAKQAMWQMSEMHHLALAAISSSPSQVWKHQAQKVFYSKGKWKKCAAGGVQPLVPTQAICHSVDREDGELDESSATDPSRHWGIGVNTRRSDSHFHCFLYLALTLPPPLQFPLILLWRWCQCDVKGP